MGRTPDGYATAKQLWRLNAEGRLALVGEGVPLTVEQADTAIRDGLGASGDGVVADAVVAGTQAALTEL